MTISLAYFLNHETIDPNTLLKHAEMANDAGFYSIWNSDHFHPWVHNMGPGNQCGFSWVWMASALERMSKIRIGTGVTAPILRYNPAIVAQAFATLAVMYPKRVFLGVGAGEALNEVPCGYEWPSPKERVERLEESIVVIKKLWTENFVTFKGKYYKLNKANLYTKPNIPIPIYLGSFGAKSAEVAGKYADGYLYLLDRSGSQRYKEVIWPAVERGAKSMGRDIETIERMSGVDTSYSEDYDEAVESSLIWRAALPPPLYKYPIYDPREVEELGKFVGKEQLAENRLITTNPEDYIKALELRIKLGFQHIYIGSCSPDQEKFFSIMKRIVIPYIMSTYGNN